MTDFSSTCPTMEQLRVLIDGGLTEEELQATQHHVDRCLACQGQLEFLVAGSESWDAAIGRMREADQSFDDPMFSEAMQRIKADDFANAHGDSNQNPANPFEYLSPSNHPGSIGRLGTYEVTHVIGQGGMGIVLKAFDPSLHRVVAVKILAPYLAHNSHARKRFVREAQAIAAVSHDHVITIHAIDESAEQPKIVMQFVCGQSLQQKIDAEGSLDLKEILRIGMQTASGLAAAHAQGLVHRDVKPSNILLENGIQRVKLTDFGLARAVDDASLTQSGVIAGTPQYMAPEQANGEGVDHRADLFSLGSVMYSMCVGHSPFRASTTMGVLKRVCHDPPRPIQELNPDIPIWLSRIIMKLLAKRPDERFQSAREVAELLERWLAHIQQPIAAPRPAMVRESSSAPNPMRSVSSRPGWLPVQLTWPLSLRVRIALGLAVFGMFLAAGASPIEIIIVTLTGWALISLWHNIAPKFLARWRASPGLSSTIEAPRPGITSSFTATFGTAESLAWFTKRVNGSFATMRKTIQGLHLWDRPDRRRNLLFVGWCLVAWVDLMCVFYWFAAMKPDFVLLLTPLSITMSICSLIVSHAILRQQNEHVVTRGALFGMLPLSPGTALRLPLTIATLIWMQRPEVKVAFAVVSWRESELGKSIQCWRQWVSKCTATGIRVSVWTLVCLALLTVGYVIYQIPYGPAEYHVLDVYSGKLKVNADHLHEEAIPFIVQATGNGPTSGLVPAIKTYRRDELNIRIGKKDQHEIRLADEILDKRTGDQISEQDCIAWFNSVLKTPDSAYGKSLFQLLTELKVNGGFSTVSSTARLPPATLSDYLSRWYESLQPRLINPPGVYRLGKLLDPQLFDSTSHEVLAAYCHSAVPWSLSWGAVALCIWLYGTWRIVAGRHFRSSPTTAIPVTT